jgi:putative transposase
MRSRYKTFENDINIPYFVTSSIVNWIPVFTIKDHFDIVVASLEYSRKYSGMKLFAYVILDNHMHLIVSSENLSKNMQSIKSFTSKQLIESLKKRRMTWILDELRLNKAAYKTESTHQVWQEGYHPQEISSQEMLFQKIAYIHNNPVRRGLVRKPEEWLYSSASSFISDNKGVLELDVL